MSLLPTGFGSQGGGYEIEQSVRLRSDASAYFSRTPASAGNRKTWTWSGWVKRGKLGTTQGVFNAGSSSSNKVTLRFSTDSKLHFESGNAGSIGYYDTQAVFRDVGAWYHIVIKFDASATSINIYINGVDQPLTTTTTLSNTDHQVNNTVQHALSGSPIDAGYLDGYLAEVNFIDGTAEDATAFGEFNDAGVWIPKAYEGTYGTNGFYLDFGDSGSIGADSSGNGNDWTANNIDTTSGDSTYDIMLDSPTDNYATLNPLNSGTAVTLSEGNAKAVIGTTGERSSISTMAVVSGKYYTETIATGGTGYQTAVACTAYDALRSSTVQVHNYTGGAVVYSNSGNKVVNGSSTAYGASYTQGDVIGVALDLDGSTVTFYKNGVSQGAISLPSSDTSAWQFVLSNGTTSNSSTMTVNFGQQPFAYTPPSGYLALCTSNLPAPSIADGSEHFNTVVYTGTGSSRTIDVGFQSEACWLKRRDVAENHSILDIVRGNDNYLYPNDTAAEGTGVGQWSPATNGFNLDSYWNGSGGSYVAWNWKANGSGVTNTDGSITSTVSANVDAGFSIVSYTGNGTGGATIGHGLSSAPDFIVVKSRDQAQPWNVYSSSLGADKVIYLNYSNASATDINRWSNTAPTSSVFSVGDGSQYPVNRSGYDFIAYCFHSVEGYSKFGSYTGNGSTNGPFVHLGFKPAFVMIKNASNVTDWHILDSTRDTYNVTDANLAPNTSGAEDNPWLDFDFLSNGFKIRNSHPDPNSSGQTIIYMAFAEHPFGGDSVAPVTAR